MLVGCNELEGISSNYDMRDQQSKKLNCLSFLCEEARDEYLYSSGASLELSQSFGENLEEFLFIIGNHYFILMQICIELLNSRNQYHNLSALRFLGSCLPATSVGTEIREHSDKLCSFLETDDILTASFATSVTYLVVVRDRVFLDELCGNTIALQSICNRLGLAHDALLCQLPAATPAVPRLQPYPKQLWAEIETMSCPPFMGEVLVCGGDTLQLSRVSSDWGVDMWGWVGAQSLALLASLADVLDVLGILLSQGVLEKVMALVQFAVSVNSGSTHSHCMCPVLALHGCRFLEKAVAHKRLACDFVEKEGLLLLRQIKMSGCSTLVETHVSGCLSTLSSHPQAVEKLIRRRRGDEELCVHLAVDFLQSGLGFQCRQHAVLSLCELLTYRPMIPLFEELCGMGELFRLLRSCVLHKGFDTEEYSDEDSSAGADLNDDVVAQSDQEMTEGSSMEDYECMRTGTSVQRSPATAKTSDDTSYAACLDLAGSIDRLHELRDDLLRTILTYLRVSAFLELEEVSPQSVTLMCGGVEAHQLAAVLVAAPADLSGNATGEQTLHPSQYTSISFDDEGTCSGAAEGLLHALRSVAIEYNDINDVDDDEGLSFPATPAVGTPFAHPLRSRRSCGGPTGSDRLLLWCLPIRMPPLNESAPPAVVTKEMLGLPQPYLFVDGKVCSDRERGGRGGPVSSRGARFFPVRELLRGGYLHLLLYMLIDEATTSRADTDAIIYLLHILELLSLNPTVVLQMGISVHVVRRMPERAIAVNMSDIEYTLNGVGIALDILNKKSPLLTAQALHLLRALVTPPQFLLLPPYYPPNEVERIVMRSLSQSHNNQSQASATPFSVLRSSACIPHYHHSLESYGESCSAHDTSVDMLGRFRDSHQTLSGEVVSPLDTPNHFLSGDDLLQGSRDNRCPSPSSTVMSLGFTPISLLLERSQRHTRTVARRCNGIQKLVTVLENSFGTTLYIHNIRLGLVQVLLGLAHDTLICALLTRLSLDHMISAISLPAMTLHEAWNVPGAKCLKRVFTSMRLCVPKLVGRINGSGALSRVNGQRTADRPCRTASECLLELLKQDDHGVERGNLEHSENALIAARTQINFDKNELLDLVSQYLQDEGFKDTAQTLRQERQTFSDKQDYEITSPLSHRSHSQYPSITSTATPQVSSASPLNSQVFTPGVQRSTDTAPHLSNTGAKRVICDVVPADKTSSKRARPSRGEDAVESPEVTVDAISSATSSKPLSIVKESYPPLSIRKKMFREAFSAPSLRRSARSAASPCTASSISFQRKASSVDTGTIQHRHTDSRRQTACTDQDKSVSLSSIVVSYLRQQHQQCQYPISVVPQFSLFNKHKCPAPDSGSMSIWDVLQQRRIFGGKLGCSRSYAKEDIRVVDCYRIVKHRVYSEYRQWRCFGEVQDNFVTAAAFGADSRKVWVGGGAGSDAHGLHYPQGGHIRVHDIHSTQELGYWDMDMNIDSIAAPIRPDIQILMTTTVATEDRYPMDRSPSCYNTCVWRAGVKASDQNASEYFLDNRSGPLVHWDNLGSPVFSPDCSSVCGLPSPFQTASDSQYALLFDTETGVQIESFRKEGIAMGAYSRSYSAPNACFGLGAGGENIVLAAGILWDCRTGGIISDFDKLSSHGFGVFHPNGNSLLIDNAVWDMRRFCLLDTVKMLENGAQAHFCTDGDGSVLFGCCPFTFDDYMSLTPHSLSHSTFFALDASDFSLIHTQDLDGDDDVVIWGTGVQSDPCGLGYLLSVEMRCNQLRRYDSCCRVREIGRRRPNYQDNDVDDAQTEDDEWDNDEGVVDEEEEDMDDDDDDDDVDDNDDDVVGSSVDDSDEDDNSSRGDGDALASDGDEESEEDGDWDEEDGDEEDEGGDEMSD